MLTARSSSPLIGGLHQDPPGPCIPPWTEFLTHAYENITFTQTSFAGGNYYGHHRSPRLFKWKCPQFRLNILCSFVQSLSFSHRHSYESSQRVILKRNWLKVPFHFLVFKVFCVTLCSSCDLCLSSVKDITVLPASCLMNSHNYEYYYFACRLPDGFTQLRNLTHLALNDVSLGRLPPDIGRYVS